jgi:hypothetical protein
MSGEETLACSATVHSARCIPRSRFCRAFSAKRFFFDLPRARGLTLGFNLASASRLVPRPREGALLLAIGYRSFRAAQSVMRFAGYSRSAAHSTRSMLAQGWLVRGAQGRPFDALNACSGQAFHFSPVTFHVHLSRDKPHLLEPGEQAEQHFFGIHPFEKPVLP